MKSSRILIFVVIFGLAAVVIGWVYESRLRTQPQQAELEVPTNIDYFLTDLNFRAVNADGVLDYEFASRRLEHYPLGDISRIDTPSLQIFRDAGRWQVDSGLGEFEHPHNLLRLKHSVVMRKLGAEPFTLYSEALRFEPDRDLVASESPVVMESKQARIEADRAEFDLGSGIYRFRGARAIYRDERS